MNNILNPRVDFAFKKLFGTESNKDLLIGLLNAILLPEDQLTDLVLLNPYTVKNLATDKLSIFDIRAVNSKGVQLSIEMQLSSELAYEKRALFLWSKLYSEQLIAGMHYSELRKAISIHLLNFDIMNEPHYHNIYGIHNQVTGTPAMTDLQIHTVELRKFETHHPDGQAVVTALDRWSTFLTRTEPLIRGDIPPGLIADPLIKKAINVLKTTSLSKEEQEIYRSHWQWMMQEKSAIEFAKSTGEAIGLEKGEAIGLEKGEAIGLEKGAKKKALQIATSMKAKGFSTQEISDLTGVSLKDM